MTTTPTLAGPPCVKCGSVKGWDGPRYDVLAVTMDGRVFGEQLKWTCLTCGYERSEPTKDARQREVQEDIQRLERIKADFTDRYTHHPTPWWAFWR